MYNPFFGGDLPKMYGVPKSMDFCVASYVFLVPCMVKKTCIYFLVYHENQLSMYYQSHESYQMGIYGDFSEITQRETHVFARKIKVDVNVAGDVGVDFSLENNALFVGWCHIS